MIQKCELHERSPCAPNSSMEHRKKHCNKNDAARREAWDLANNFHKLNDKDKPRFFSLSEVWSFPALSSTKLEER